MGETENIPVSNHDTPETSTYAGTDASEAAIREWESRLHDTNRGGSRFMNTSTVSTLLDAIRNDDNFMNVAYLSLSDPTLTHDQLVTAYRNPQQGALIFKTISSGNHGIDRQTLLNIDSDLAALCMQDDRTKNGRVFALRAAVAYLSGNNDALREYANMAAYLDQDGARLRQDDPRVPASTDTLTIIMGTYVAMRAQSMIDDADVAKYKEQVNADINEREERMSILNIPNPTESTPRMSVPSYSAPRLAPTTLGIRI